MAHHEKPAHCGIRTQTHKLIVFYGLPFDAHGAKPRPTPPHWELYDLTKDPGEMNNMARDPDAAKVFEQLKERLFEIKKQVGDTDDPYPKLQALYSSS